MRRDTQDFAYCADGRISEIRRAKTRIETEMEATTMNSHLQYLDAYFLSASSTLIPPMKFPTRPA
jgi:hypothetical protein